MTTSKTVPPGTPRPSTPPGGPTGPTPTGPNPGRQLDQIDFPAQQAGAAEYRGWM